MIDYNYHKLLKEILNNGYEYEDPNRKSVIRKQINSYNIKHEFKHGFPLLTTKFVSFKSVVGEFLTFIKGDNTLGGLEKNGVKFWRKDALRWLKQDPKYSEAYKKIIDTRGAEELVRLHGEDIDLGKIYPYQMRNWDGKIDQLQELVNTLINNPMATKKTVTMWNPSDKNQTALTACFTEDALINTRRGLVKIKDIEEGDLVITKEGNYKKVYAKSENDYSGTIIGINKKGSNDLIKCTPNHKFYVKDKGWVQALDIKEGDYIGVPINNNSIIPNKKYFRKQNDKTGIYVHLDMENPDLWWVMGYFVGDGYVDKNSNRISFCVRDSESDVVLPKLKKIFPTISKGAYKKNSGKSKLYYISRLGYASLFREFGHLAPNKFIPQFVVDAPTQLIKEFIEGYRAADGTKTVDFYQFGTVSPSLAYGVNILMTKLKIPTSVSKSKRDKYKMIQGRKVKQREFYYTVNSLSRTSIDHDTFFEGDYLWQRVQDKYFFKDMKTKVYNMSVEDSHSYTVFNTIVKNCHWSFEALVEPLENDVVYSYGLTIRWLQHSCDVFLGIPFNIAYYSLMCYFLAEMTGMKPLGIEAVLSNVHIYDNHMEAVKEQLNNDVNKYNLPSFKFSDTSKHLFRRIKNLDVLDYITTKDFIIENYESYPRIKAEMLTYNK